MLVGRRNLELFLWTGILYAGNLVLQSFFCTDSYLISFFPDGLRLYDFYLFGLFAGDEGFTYIGFDAAAYGVMLFEFMFAVLTLIGLFSKVRMRPVERDRLLKVDAELSCIVSSIFFLNLEVKLMFGDTVPAEDFLELLLLYDLTGLLDYWNALFSLFFTSAIFWSRLFIHSWNFSWFSFFRFENWILDCFSINNYPYFFSILILFLSLHHLLKLSSKFIFFSSFLIWFWFFIDSSFSYKFHWATFLIFFLSSFFSAQYYTSSAHSGCTLL